METKRLIVSTNYINLHASDRERKRQSNDRMRKRVRRETVKTGEERQTTAGLPYYFFKQQQQHHVTINVELEKQMHQ